MSRSNNALLLLLIAVLGAWGCARSPLPRSDASADRLRNLASRCVKLEDEYRTVVCARDQLRKHSDHLEAENVRMAKAQVQLSKELEETKALAKECDQLRLMVETRTSERDILQVRCDRLKKGMKTILGEDEAMAPAKNQTPVLRTMATADGGNL